MLLGERDDPGIRAASGYESHEGDGFIFTGFSLVMIATIVVIVVAITTFYFI